MHILNSAVLVIYDFHCIVLISLVCCCDFKLDFIRMADSIKGLAVI